ncbi:MAG: hypothetical protein AAB674_03335 [Patescibacteria group bacterium]
MSKSLKQKSKKFMSPNARHGYGKSDGGEKGLVICPECRAAYYKKRWRHNEAYFKGKETAPVNFMLCPADQMIKNRQYEGKVVVRNFPEDLEGEIINLIKNAANLAYEKDPMHRLISVGKVGKELIAFITENELAASIAKKIGNAYNKAKVKISFSAKPEGVALAVVEF